MSTNANLNILCLGAYNTGDRFIERARERGCRVWVITREKALGKPWRRDLLDDVYALPNDATLAATVDAVCYLNRTTRFDRIVPFDEIEVETAAMLREHLRVPGMGDTRARVFRDKLAMRVRAREEDIPVPDFVGALHYPDIEDFVRRVPPPWMLKPRLEASSSGITRLESAEQLWAELARLGDLQSFYLIEKYVPGDVHHVDAIVSDARVVFMECHRNGRPPWDVTHGGGAFSTFTVERGSADEAALRATTEKLLTRFGLLRGTAHVEFIKGRDGVVYFLEAGARIGGAHVADVVEAATGINLWREWAEIEIDKGERPYVLPPARAEYAGLVQCLARQEKPDLSAYDDPEVVLHTGDAHHAGVVVRASSPERVRALLERYAERFADDFLAQLPHYELPARRA
jgi:biotin carboxylase